MSLHKFVMIGAMSTLIPTLAMAHPLDLARARRIADTAFAEAKRLQAPGLAVAVVDAGGQPIVLERIDGTFAAAGTVSLGKARTAALFGRPTKVLEDAINKGRTAMLALTTTIDATPMQGGVPLVIDGVVVGAVGVSGAASADQDTQIAEAAALAVADPAAFAVGKLEHFSAEQVRTAFEGGKPLLEGTAYKIHASRRVSPGEAEIHTLDTDIFYVLEGEATLVLGGMVTETRNLSPTEIRGKTIEGGSEHSLKTGDVLVIPAGTPHWFRDVVRGPVLYYTVKVAGGPR